METLTLSANAIEAFQAAISFVDTRVKNLPPIVLVFGGPLGDPNGSARQMFINWMMVNGHPINASLRTPEQYSDWNQFEGYSNLIDFEQDAGNLAQAIVLFSESEGSYAELGAFCMDNVLSERLFVVISKEHHDATSFIANGPVKKIELIHDDSICVVDSISPAEILKVMAEVASALEEKVNAGPKSEAFDPNLPRDQFLLVADLVELFGALTLGELHGLLKFAGVGISFERLEEIVNQLRRFGLVELIHKTTKRFLVPPKDRRWYLRYQAPTGLPAFDRSRFKMTKAFPWLNADGRRLKAYLEIHPKA